MKSLSEFQDVMELAKRSHYTIVLDENLKVLEAGLEDEGYKVIVFPPGMKDPDIKKLSRGDTILTASSKDFVGDALHFDYDVIAVENVKFIDTKQDRTNQTVVKIAKALTRSELASLKGNFVLTIHDDGSFHLRQLP